MSGAGEGVTRTGGAAPLNCGDLPSVGRSWGPIGILVVTIVLSAAVSMVASVGLQRRQQQSRLVERYSPLADIAEDQIGGLRGEGWKALALMKLRPLMQDRGVVFVSLVDSRGDEVLTLGERSAGSAGTYFTASAPNSQTLTRRVIGGRGESMTLRLGVVDAEANGSLRTMAAAIGAGLIVSLLIGLGLLTRWQRRRSEGRRRLLEGLRRLMLDAPLKPLPVNGKGEEAYLARAFNRLSAQSVEQRRTIADLMTQLSVRTVATEDRGRLEIDIAKQEAVWLRSRLRAACSLNEIVTGMTREMLQKLISECVINGRADERQHAVPAARVYQLESMTRAIDVCGRMTGLTQSKQSTYRESIELREAIDELIPFFVARAAAAGVTFETEFAENMPRVIVAREAFQTALLLSGSRAIEAADETHVTLSARVVDAVVEISFGPCGLKSERLMRGDEIVCGLAATWFGAEIYEERSGRLVLTAPTDQTEALVGSFLTTADPDETIWVAIVRLPRGIDARAIYERMSQVVTPRAYAQISENQRALVVAGASGERVLSAESVNAHVRSGIEPVLPAGHGVTIDTILCSIQQAESCILNALRSEHQGLISEAA